MRILIISFDGLEYDWVKMFNLVGLKQKEYGKVDLSPILNLENREIPYQITTEVYATMVSGKNPVEGITGKKVLIHETLMERNIPSLFNLPNSLSVEVPSVAYPLQTAFSHSLIAEHVHKSRELELRKKLLDIAEEKTRLFEKKKLFNKKLVMVYYNFTDELAHLSVIVNSHHHLFIVYRKAEEIAHRLTKAFGEGLVIVISDHGMKVVDGIGKHSDHGFYSLSQPLGWQGIKITEVYDKIVRLYNEA